MQIHERRRRRSEETTSTQRLINHAYRPITRRTPPRGSSRMCLPRDIVVAASLAPMCMLPGVPLAPAEQLGTRHPLRLADSAGTRGTATGGQRECGRDFWVAEMADGVRGGAADGELAAAEGAAGRLH